MSGVEVASTCTRSQVLHGHLDSECAHEHGESPGIGAKGLHVFIFLDVIFIGLQSFSWGFPKNPDLDPS